MWCLNSFGIHLCWNQPAVPVNSPCVQWMQGHGKKERTRGEKKLIGKKMCAPEPVWIIWYWCICTILILIHTCTYALFSCFQNDIIVCVLLQNRRGREWDTGNFFGLALCNIIIIKGGGWLLWSPLILRQYKDPACDVRMGMASIFAWQKAQNSSLATVRLRRAQGELFIRQLLAAIWR